MMLGTRHCALPLVMIAALTSFALADDKPKSLDDQLLEDLGGEVVPGAAKPATPEKAAALPGKSPSDAGLDDKLLDQLGAGEDLEFGPPQDPLARIGKQMKAAETLIGRRDTSARTQDVQKQILTGLEKLLEQTRQQCQQCQNPAGGPPKPGSAKAGNKPAQDGDVAQQPPKDSTERMGKPGETKADEEAVAALVKEVWGHLPDKVRLRMQTVSVEEFLPKYEKLIEAYYKRLAEENQSPR